MNYQDQEHIDTQIVRKYMEQLLDPNFDPILDDYALLTTQLFVHDCKSPCSCMATTDFRHEFGCSYYTNDVLQ